MNCDKRDAFQSKVSNMEIEYHNGGFFLGTPSNICTIDKIFSTSSESSGIDGGSCVFSHGGSRLGIGRAKRDELLKKEEKDAKARKKTAVVGDMKPMEETLKIINHDIVQVCLTTKALNVTQ